MICNNTVYVLNTGCQYCATVLISSLLSRVLHYDEQIVLICVGVCVWCMSVKRFECMYVCE